MEVSLPTCLSDGRNGFYTGVVIENSEVPALWGLLGLSQNRAIIDTFNRKVFLIGPGTYELKAPPGSSQYSPEVSPSGHLFLPITEYDKQPQQVHHKPMTL